MWVARENHFMPINNLTLRVNKRKAVLFVACIFFCIGIFVIFTSLRMPRGSFNTPGPGFYPGLLGVLLCGISLVLGFISLHQRNNTETVLLGHLDIWTVIFALIIVAVLLERIGFILVFTLFLVLLFKKLSGLKWIKCIILAFSCAIITYLFFNTILGVRLPPFFTGR